MPARDSAMPNAGHSRPDSSGPAGGSGHGPPPGDERVRSAAAGELVQHRPRRLGIVVRPAAAGAPGGRAAVGEVQAEPEGAAGRGQVPRPAGPVLPG